MKTAKNAHIALSENWRDTSSAFEVVLGLDSTDKVVIRKSIGGTVEVRPLKPWAPAHIKKSHDFQEGCSRLIYSNSVKYTRKRMTLSKNRQNFLPKEHNLIQQLFLIR